MSLTAAGRKFYTEGKFRRHANKPSAFWLGIRGSPSFRHWPVTLWMLSEDGKFITDEVEWKVKRHARVQKVLEMGRGRQVLARVPLFTTRELRAGDTLTVDYRLNLR